jgi:predicted nucleic acid-binding protein
MIFDSTIWIDYLRGVKSTYTDLLDKKLDSYGQIDVHLCPPIFQEVLQGIRISEKYEAVKELLITSQFLQIDSYFAADGASFIYRNLRSKGITIRKSNDCLIAFYAIRFKTSLVHNDNDFNEIAKHTSLKVYTT